MLMSHTATSPVALPAGPSIPAVVSCAVRMGGAIVQPLGKHSGGAMPHPHSWATGVSWTSSTVSVYPPDYNVDNRAASTLDIGCHTPPSSGRTPTDQSCFSPPSSWQSIARWTTRPAPPPSTPTVSAPPLSGKKATASVLTTMGPASAMWISSTTPARTWSHLPGSPPTPGSMRLPLLLHFSRYLSLSLFHTVHILLGSWKS